MDIEKACKECYELGFLDAVSQRPDRGQDAVDCCAISMESAWDDSDAKKAADAIAENLAVFDAFDSPFDLILKTGEVFKFVRYQGGKLVYRSEDGATAYPTRREKTLLRAAIEGGATVVLAGGE